MKTTIERYKKACADTSHSGSAIEINAQVLIGKSMIKLIIVDYTSCVNVKRSLATKDTTYASYKCSSMTYMSARSYSACYTVKLGVNLYVIELINHLKYLWKKLI